MSVTGGQMTQGKQGGGIENLLTALQQKRQYQQQRSQDSWNVFRDIVEKQYNNNFAAAFQDPANEALVKQFLRYTVGGKLQGLGGVDAAYKKMQGMEMTSAQIRERGLKGVLDGLFESTSTGVTAPPVPASPAGMAGEVTPAAPSLTEITQPTPSAAQPEVTPPYTTSTRVTVPASNADYYDRMSTGDGGRLPSYQDLVLSIIGEGYADPSNQGLSLGVAMDRAKQVYRDLLNGMPDGQAKKDALASYDKVVSQGADLLQNDEGWKKKVRDAFVTGGEVYTPERESRWENDARRSKVSVAPSPAAKASPVQPPAEDPVTYTAPTGPTWSAVEDWWTRSKGVRVTTPSGKEMVLSGNTYQDVTSYWDANGKGNNTVALRSLDRRAGETGVPANEFTDLRSRVGSKEKPLTEAEKAKLEEFKAKDKAAGFSPEDRNKYDVLRAEMSLVATEIYGKNGSSPSSPSSSASTPRGDASSSSPSLPPESSPSWEGLLVAAGATPGMGYKVRREESIRTLEAAGITPEIFKKYAPKNLDPNTFSNGAAALAKPPGDRTVREQGDAAKTSRAVSWQLSALGKQVRENGVKVGNLDPQRIVDLMNEAQVGIEDARDNPWVADFFFPPAVERKAQLTLQQRQFDEAMHQFDKTMEYNMSRLDLDWKTLEIQTKLAATEAFLKARAGGVDTGLFEAMSKIVSARTDKFKGETLSERAAELKVQLDTDAVFAGTYNKVLQMLTEMGEGVMGEKGVQALRENRALQNTVVGGLFDIVFPRMRATEIMIPTVVYPGAEVGDPTRQQEYDEATKDSLRTIHTVLGD